MYRINTANGAIHCPDGWICYPPYDDVDLPHYLDYANWVNSGNSPEEFYEEPPAPVPQAVSRFQARAALYQFGFFDQVEQMMQSPDTPMIAKLAWQDAQEFRRNSQLVNQMCTALGMTAEQIDELFRVAASIEV